MALPTATIPQKSQGKVSESYDDIPLTDDEMGDALRQAREKKFYRLQEQEREARASELRRMLTERWSYEKTRDWMEQRVGERWPLEHAHFEDVLSENGNQIVGNAGTVFTLLCLYFSVDPRFVTVATELGVERADLRKGILLAGPVGCGKTSLMHIFQRNQRQVFMIKSAKEIAWNWRQAEKDAGEYMEKMTRPHMLPVNDVQNFYHRFAGLCIDDVGTEDIQNSFGNRASVIADIVEGRYFNSCAGPLFHITTNLTMPDLKSFYGERVASRLRETMNIIGYTGEDRRK